MSAATAATTATPKTAAALRFLSADTTTGIVAYATPSQHDAGRTKALSIKVELGRLLVREDVMRRRVLAAQAMAGVPVTTRQVAKRSSRI